MMTDDALNSREEQYTPVSTINDNNNEKQETTSDRHGPLGDHIMAQRRFLVTCLHLFPHNVKLRQELYTKCLAPLEKDNLYSIRDNMWYHITNLKRYCSSAVSLLADTHTNTYCDKRQLREQKACRNAIIQALLFMEHLTTIGQEPVTHDFDIRGILIQMSHGMHDASSSMGGVFWLFLCYMSRTGDFVANGQFLLFFSRFMKHYDLKLFMAQYKLRPSFLSDLLYRVCKEAIDIYYSKSRETNRGSSSGDDSTSSNNTAIRFETVVYAESDSIQSQAIFTWRQKRNLKHHYLLECLRGLNFIRSQLPVTQAFSTNQMNYFHVKFVQVLMQMGTRESLLQASDTLKQLMIGSGLTEKQLGQYWYLMACIQFQLVQFNSCITSFETAISTLKSGHETIDMHILYHFHHVLKLLESQKRALEISGLYPAQLQDKSADGYWQQICSKYEISNEMNQLKQVQFTTAEEMINHKQTLHA